MRIAMVSWLHGRPVPPTGYGGIERMTATLTAELVRQGHNVILVAPEGSDVEGAVILPTSNFDEAYEHIRGFGVDIIHSNECWSLESVVRRPLNVPFICTTHVNDAIGWSKNVVYLSEAQRAKHASQLGIDLATSPILYVPINPELRPQHLPRQDYLLFLGSIVPCKGVREAAQVAKLLGRELIVAGPIDTPYADEVSKMPNVTMVGEVTGVYRDQLIEQAWAMMCLHNNHNGWVESGCGVVGEAMAFNTPVAAFPNGCLSEQIINGRNGWIANSVDDIATYMDHAPYPSNFYQFQSAWSAYSIVKCYVSLYEQICSGRTWG